MSVGRGHYRNCTRHNDGLHLFTPMSPSTHLVLQLPNVSLCGPAVFCPSGLVLSQPVSRNLSVIVASRSTTVIVVH